MSYGKAIGDAIVGIIIVAFIGGGVFTGLCWLLWHFVLSHVTVGWV